MDDNNNNNKKKRNKKKKNKLAKTTEDEAVVAVGEDQNGAIDYGKNGNHHDSNPSRDTDLIDVPNGVLQTSDVDGFDRHKNNGAEISTSMEAEKQQWLRREELLENTITQLRNENDSHMKKEEILTRSMKQLQEENGLHLQKQVTLEEAIKELRNANDSALLKEVRLEDTIKELRNAYDLVLAKETTFKELIQNLKYENDSQKQKGTELEKKLAQLQSEKELCILKEAKSEERIEQLESDKDSWILAENTAKETISRMDVDITRLQMQVVELEKSRNSLLKENQQLMENISDLRLQLQNLETNISSANASDELEKHASEREDLKSQIEAACALVDKLIMENSELVEKVNELYIKLDRQSSVAALSSAISNDLIPRSSAAALSSAISNDLIPRNAEITGPADSIPESTENMSVVVHKLESLEIEPASRLPYATEADTGEIVQIPLDDNVLRDLELQTVESDKMEPVPISDAPLIGAPFRLISFVAKYVSGADLVDKDASNPGS